MIYMCVCACVCLCVCIIPPNTQILRKVLRITNIISPYRNVNSSTLESPLYFLFHVYLFMLLLILVFESQIFYSVLVFSLRMLERHLYHWMTIFFPSEVLYSVLLGRWFLVLIPVPLISGISCSKPFNLLMLELPDSVLSWLYFHNTQIVSF